MGLGQYEKSLKILTHVLSLDPDNIPTLLALNRISLARGEYGAAERYLGRALQIDPNRAETRVLAGRLALARGNFERARQVFGKLRADQHNPEVYLGIAQSFLAEGRPDAASEYIRKLQAAVGPVPELQYLDSVAAIQRGELSSARALLLDVLKNSPEHIDGLLLSASVNYERQEYRQAESGLNRLLNIHPGNNKARLLQATVQIELGQTDKAIEALKMMEEQTPNDGQLIALLARAHMLADRVDEAEVYLQRAAQQTSSAEGLSTEHA